MAEGYMADVQMVRKTNEYLEQRARECEPVLTECAVVPAGIVDIIEDGNAVRACNIAPAEALGQYKMGKGDSVCLDFGNHYVGYVTLTLKSAGSPQDAPAYIRLKFGEVLKEILENSEDYDGWISRSWIQEEFLHIDVLPARITLPRRYAFRYLEILAVDTSKKWKLVVEEVALRAVSSADGTKVKPVMTEDALLSQIDKVSIRTLQNCMQSVFEDGPKRDRRLWLGDLRLQALANYKTFQADDLVKRCLYLFAAQTREDGRISACLFLEPEYIVDDTFFFDYSLFFIAALYDYYMETKDIKTLEDLWDSAYRQIELAGEEFDGNHLLIDREDFKCFIDWKAGLNKQAGGQAVYIYCVKRAAGLARILGKEDTARYLETEVQNKKQAALDYLWDNKEKVFVSGTQRQISYASQVWMTLAEVPAKETARELMKRLLDVKWEMNMVTPYMNHHFAEALIQVGEKNEAVDYMKYYWGGMVKQGADTFWELYNPENPEESPYGSSMINSYCHAWSCTPAYLLRI